MSLAKPAQQDRFYDEYLIVGNACEAALKAGFTKATALKRSYAWVQEERGKVPPSWRTAWDKYQKKRKKIAARSQVTAEKILKEEASIAFFDPGSVLTETGELCNLQEVQEIARKAIASMTFDKDTGRVTNIKFTDKGAALARLHKHLGCCAPDKTKQEHSITGEAEVLKKLMDSIADKNTVIDDAKG